MEEQHPIPQQISTYQFRLVGDMTLKQFLQVGGGLLIALIIYSTPIIGLIKWPLVMISALGGAALAFLPFQERPLEKWIVAFLRSIYSPTLFYWQKLPEGTTFFQEQAAAPAFVPSPPPAGYPTLVPSAPPTSAAPQAIAPQGAGIFPGTPPIPGQSPTVGPGPVQPAPAGVAPAGASVSETIEPGVTIFPNLEEAEKTFLSKITGLFSLAPSLPVPGAAGPQVSTGGREELRVERSTPIKFKPLHKEQDKEFDESSIPEPVFVSVAPTLAPSRKLTEEFAQFSEDAAPPFPPSLPNVVVGQVMDSNKKIVEGAILEIKDSAGRPVRALKSNKLGHFMIVTPLTNGRYSIETEKNGYVFDPVTFDALGNIIPPIAIRAKSAG